MIGVLQSHPFQSLNSLQLQGIHILKEAVAQLPTKSSGKCDAIKSLELMDTTEDFREFGEDGFRW
jgi:hypothetical protein